ncbi:MAG: hypothetical protein BRD26_05845, partial [Bacteroidetes bacterium QH_1_64_81]
MRSRTFIFVLAGFVLAVAGNGVLAQQEAPSASEAGPEWESELIGKISASQAAYRNWQEGGLNSLSFTTLLDGLAERQGD